MSTFDSAAESDFERVERISKERRLVQLGKAADEARIAKRARITKIVDCHAWVEQKYKDWMTNILMEVLP